MTTRRIGCWVALAGTLSACPAEPDADDPAASTGPSTSANDPSEGPGDETIAASSDTSGPGGLPTPEDSSDSDDGPRPAPGSTTDSSSEPPNGAPCDGADILCDDFEDPAGLDAQWAYTGNPAHMPIFDDSRSFTGQRSLTFPATDTQGAFIYPSEGWGDRGGLFYVRAHVSFARDMSEMGGHVSFIVAADQPSNGAEMRVGASTNFGTGMMMLDINLLGSGPEYTQFSNGDVTGGSPSGAMGTSLSANTWYCMIALFDGESHEFRLWLDGAELPTMHVTDWQAGVTEWSPQYALIKIGGQNYSGTLGQIWFDDVAMSTQPLSCP